MSRHNSVVEQPKPKQKYRLEELTAIAVTGTMKRPGDRLLTGCTGGRIKCWDISKVDFKRIGRDHMQDVRVSWYIQAHKKMGGSINSLSVVEAPKVSTERFVVSASTDNNILLHRISSGVRIGQFNQEKLWKIKSMAEFDNKRPNLVSDWLRGKIKVWKEFLEERIRIAKERKLIDEEVTVKTVKNLDKEILEKIGVVDETGKASLGELSANGSDMGDVDYL